MKEKYKILLDYGSEGFVFRDEEFESVTEAVKFAVENVFYNKYIIVKMVNWEVKEIN